MKIEKITTYFRDLNFGDVFYIVRDEHKTPCMKVNTFTNPYDEVINAVNLENGNGYHFMTIAQVVKIKNAKLIIED